MVWRNTLHQVMTQQPVIILGVESFDLRDERKRILSLSTAVLNSRDG